MIGCGSPHAVRAPSSMDIQNVIVIAIIAVAVGYAVTVVFRKRRAFSPKHGCANDCGCHK